MNHIISKRIAEMREEAQKHGVELSEDRAFSYLLVSLFCSNDNMTFYDVDACVTDGKDDGGIDFVFFDDSDDGRLIVGQSKLTGALTANTVFSELDKMHSTVSVFKEDGNTGGYNQRLRKALREGLDSFTDDSALTIEYYICSSAEANVDAILDKLDKSERQLTSESVTIYSQKELLAEINKDWETTSTVPEFKFNLDKSKNCLEYSSGSLQGAMVNISSKSISKLYDEYSNSGLFDLNIRKYVRSKAVDSGIKRTLDKSRDRFWFLNNGLTIVCSDYSISGDRIKIYNFSIVNGGQTTYLIGNYKGSNNDEFFVPCKVVCDSSLQNTVSEQSMYFFSEIAQATNSQKKISARDLRSNSREMKSLQKLLQIHGVYMEVKRGDNPDAKKTCSVSIKNETFAQLYTSFVYQLPGTARNKKSYLFENEQAYSKVFRQNFQKDPQKTAFVVDLARLFDRYLLIEKKLKGNLPEATENDILANGRCMLFALFGALYAVVNGDANAEDIERAPKDFCQTSCVYGSFLSNYLNDDIDVCIEFVARESVRIASETYRKLLAGNECTSASNFLKTDVLYQERLLPNYAHTLYSYTNGKEIMARSLFLRR